MSAPWRFPPSEGEKARSIVHDAPTSKGNGGLGQVPPVMLKSPLWVMFVTLSWAVPLFINVAARAALVRPTTSTPKMSDVGLIVATGVPGGITASVVKLATFPVVISPLLKFWNTVR